MELRIIKTDRQYRRYLEEARRLVARDPDPRTAEGARLELMAKLIGAARTGRQRFSPASAPLRWR
jgi:HTH-type transcriptional regulator / antitoxin HigA